MTSGSLLQTLKETHVDVLFIPSTFHHHNFNAPHKLIHTKMHALPQNSTIQHFQDG